jgi:hypothetical protein
VTDTEDVITSWLEALTARGVKVTLRGNRLWLHPPEAYHTLTDDELLTLRHHRAAIKARLIDGAAIAVPEPATPEPKAAIKEQPKGDAPGGTAARATRPSPWVPPTSLPIWTSNAVPRPGAGDELVIYHCDGSVEVLTGSAAYCELHRKPVRER